MIQILYFFLLLPFILGMLSVDVNGQPFSLLEYVTDRLQEFRDSREDEDVIIVGNYNQTDNEIEESDIANIILPERGSDGFPPESQEIFRKFTESLYFLALQAKDFGTSVGMQTAPFHFVIVFLIVGGLIFTYEITWIVAFFYLLVTEFDEFKNIRKKDVI